MPRFFKAFRAHFKLRPPFFAAVILMTTAGCAGFRSCPSGDDWFGADKLKHFALSGVIAAGVTAALHEEDPETAAVAGMGVAMAAGATKEWHDLYRRDTCWSWRDLAWDFIGASVGVTAAAAARD